MKKFTLIILLNGLISMVALSQITITTDDMPNIGDTIRLSSTVFVQGIDYTETGEDYTWDFSSLLPLSQQVDTFVSVTSTPLLYQFVFIPYIISNIASPIGEIDFIPNFEFTDIYQFYKNTDTEYKDVGFAFSFNEIPIPIKYDDPDILYEFPMNMSNVDSSESGFEFNLDGLIYVSSFKKRVNTVDGWGTLITPYGSFQTLRLKSEIEQYDSIYIDSLGFGFPVYREITEYKWLGNNFGLPLLQINEEGFTLSVNYIDSARISFAPPAPNAIAATNITQTSFDANWETSIYAEGYYLYVATDTGFTSFVLGYENLNIENVATYNVSGLSANTGFYYRLRAYNAGGTSGNSNVISVTTISDINELKYKLLNINVYPNPCDGIITLEYNLPEPSLVSISLYSMLGYEIKNLINTSKHAGTHKESFNLKKLNIPSGEYLFRIIIDDTIYIKIIIVN